MKEPNVNVAIMSTNKVEFILYGDYNSKEFTNTFNGKMSAETSDGMVILNSNGNKLDPQQEIVLSPVDDISESFLLKDVTIGLQFHWEQKQDQRFTGSLKFIIEDEKLTVINVVPVEQYLRSVISSEMSATSSLELLKAHAIISRSWLLAQMVKENSLEELRNYISEFKTDDEIIKWYDREDHFFMMFVQMIIAKDIKDH